MCVCASVCVTACVSVCVHDFKLFLHFVQKYAKNPKKLAQAKASLTSAIEPSIRVCKLYIKLSRTAEIQ